MLRGCILIQLGLSLQVSLETLLILEIGVSVYKFSSLSFDANGKIREGRLMSSRHLPRKIGKGYYDTDTLKFSRMYFNPDGTIYGGALTGPTVVSSILGGTNYTFTSVSFDENRKITGGELLTATNIIIGGNTYSFKNLSFNTAGKIIGGKFSTPTDFIISFYGPSPFTFIGASFRDDGSIKGGEFATPTSVKVKADTSYSFIKVELDSTNKLITGHFSTPKVFRVGTNDYLISKIKFDDEGNQDHFLSSFKVVRIASGGHRPGYLLGTNTPIRFDANGNVKVSNLLVEKDDSILIPKPIQYVEFTHTPDSSGVTIKGYHQLVHCNVIQYDPSGNLIQFRMGGNHNTVKLI